MSKTVLVTGSTGQLGKALKIFMPNEFKVFFLDKNNFLQLKWY